MKIPVLLIVFILSVGLVVEVTAINYNGYVSAFLLSKIVV
jgi:hypothetical protein